MIKHAFGYADGNAGSAAEEVLQLAYATGALKPRRMLTKEEWDAMGSSSHTHQFLAQLARAPRFHDSRLVSASWHGKRPYLAHSTDPSNGSLPLYTLGEGQHSGDGRGG